MANETAKALYDKQANLARTNAQTAYEVALANLGRRFGLANRQLESNLESRGILRSGEANMARTELTAQEQAEKTAAEMARTSALDQADLTLAQQLAGLMTSSSGGGGGTTSGQPQYDFSKVDFNGLGQLMKANNRPVRDAAPRPPVPAGAYGTTRPTTTNQFDFSKVDFAGLGQLMRANKPVNAAGRAM
jgi:multidrug efflux pump subunit AcrA (membrane-fusion protein)